MASLHTAMAGTVLAHRPHWQPQTSSFTELCACCLHFPRQVHVGVRSAPVHLLLALMQHLSTSLARRCLAGAVLACFTSASSEILYVPLLQFQSFSQYRGKMAHKTAHELELLRDCVGVWDVNTVLQILQSLIDKSQVGQKLGNEGEQFVPQAAVM